MREEILQCKNELEKNEGNRLDEAKRLASKINIVLRQPYKIVIILITDLQHTLHLFCFVTQKYCFDSLHQLKCSFDTIDNHSRTLTKRQEVNTSS